MRDPYRVTFLFDPRNTWIADFFHDFQIPNSEKYIISKTQNPCEVTDQDIVFILGYTRILDSAFLDANRLCLVVHESNLPLGKGFAPVQWQILEGKTQIPICLIEATRKVDSGDIFLKEYFTLDGTELYDEIRLAQGAATKKIVQNFW